MRYFWETSRKNPKRFFKWIPVGIHGLIPVGTLGGNPGGISEKVHRGIPAAIPDKISV